MHVLNTMEHISLFGTIPVDQVRVCCQKCIFWISGSYDGLLPGCDLLVVSCFHRFLIDALRTSEPAPLVSVSMATDRDVAVGVKCSRSPSESHQRCSL